MSRNPTIEFDKLRLYFKEPYVIDVEAAEGTLTLYQPSIRDLIRIGEDKFFSSLQLLITNTTQNRLMLWEAGVDWNEMSDFEFFLMIYKQITPEVNEVFFGDIQLGNFQQYQKKLESGDEIVLYDKERNIEINEDVYFHISQCLRAMFNIYPDEQITHDKILKKWFIDKDRRHIANMKVKEERGEKPETSMIAVVSAYVNHPGTKYKTSELKDVGVYEFYDAVQRLQIYESSTALMKGMYSGFVDGKKIKTDDYNFMREIKKNN